MNILGIDPGLADCGFAVVSYSPGLPCRLVRSWTARTSPKLGLPERVAAIGHEVASGEWTHAAIEAWTYQGERSRHESAVQISRVIERCRVVLESNGAKVIEIPTLTCKSVVGCAPRKPGLIELRRVCVITDPPTTQHARDAIAAAVAGARFFRSKT